MAADLVSIGAVAVDYRRPSVKFSGGPTTHGIRACSIDGLVEDAAADTLSELVNNPAAQVSVGGFTGVQEYLTFTGTLAGKTGYYILENFDETTEHSMMFTGFTAFSLTGAYLGDLG